MNILSSYERDAFAESFNIGIGKAASSLSEMIGQEVSMSIPNVEVLEKSEAVRGIGGAQLQRIRGVRENFGGPLSGSALLLFPEDRSLEFVRLLVQDDSELEFLTEMEQEALIEVGNILINSCLSSIAAIVGDEIINEIPDPVSGEVEEIIVGDKVGGGGNIEEYVLSLRVDFSVEGINLDGYIVFVMDISSLDTFRQKLADYFGYDAA